MVDNGLVEDILTSYVQSKVTGIGLANEQLARGGWSAEAMPGLREMVHYAPLCISGQYAQLK